MTSTVSNKENKRISPFMHNMLCEIKSKTRMIIILCIFHFVAAPAAIISMIVSIYAKNPGDTIDAFIILGGITTAVAGILGISAAVDSFSCLHKKSVVDMRLALPMTATQRFFSNFLAGLAVYIGPFIAAQVVSLLGMAYGFLFMEGRTFYEPRYTMGELVYKDYVCEYFGMAMPILLKLILCGLLVMLMLYTLTVFVTVCCGNKSDSIAYTLLLNVIIPLTIYIVFMSMFYDLYGVEMALSLVIIRLIMYTSPAGGIMAAMQWCSDGYFADDLNMNFAVWAVVYFLLTVAIGAAAFFLYRKRRAEQVSKPFVFKPVYYIISSAVIFCTYSIFYTSHSQIAPIIITTLIIYLILEVAANRGFKKIWLSFIKYIGVMGASVLIIFVSQKTEGFGMVTRVPDISAVKSVELEYGGFYGIFSLYTYGEDKYSYSTKTLTFTEKENIETIIAAHQSRVDTREDRYDWGAGVKVRIVYHLKNGGRLEREYQRFAPLQAEMLSRLDLTDEYKTQVAEIYRKHILKCKEECLTPVRQHSAESDFYNDNWEVTLNTRFADGKTGYGGEHVRAKVLAENNFFEQLADAYAADIMNITEENYYQSSSGNERYLYLSNWSGALIIPDSFENTLAVLENHGFEIFYKEKLSDRETAALLYDISKNSNSGICLLTAAEWREVNVVPNGVRLHASYDSGNGLQSNFVTAIDKDICDIFRAAEIMNIVPDNGYIICVSGVDSMVVPEELNGIAERVYSRTSVRNDPDNITTFWDSSDDIQIIAEEAYN